MPVTLIKTKWSSGELIFYDVATGNEIFRIKDGTDGVDFSQPIAVESQIIVGSRFSFVKGPYAAVDVSNAETVFFVAPAPCKVVSAVEVHETAGGTTGWIDLYKNGSGISLGNGTKILGTGFNISDNATADMYASQAVTDSTGITHLTTGDRISIKGSVTGGLVSCMVGLIMEWV